MGDKVFPIRTDTSCPLKWSWSTLYLYQGQSASCHRTGYDTLTEDNFDQFHNTEKKQQERLAMLNGQWPVDSCKYCRDIEADGGFSDRNLQLNTSLQYPSELDSDSTALSVTPTMLEVYFNYTCNMACLYCIPTLSSKINQENKKFGSFEKNGISLKHVDIVEDHSGMIDRFWTWMNTHSQSLARLTIAGGEPFYQEEFYKCLDYFENSSHPNLEIGIISNLMTAPDKLDSIVARFKNLVARKKVKKIILICSLDCWGKEQEYVRYGLDLDLWKKNFERLLTHKWLTLGINQTISVLTIKTMPDLLARLSEWRKQRPISHSFSVVAPQPSYMRPTMFGPDVFAKDFETIISLMPTDNEANQSASEYMIGIAKEISASTFNKAEALKLKTFLDEKDRRRNTNWKQTFPWLNQIFNQHLENTNVV